MEKLKRNEFKLSNLILWSSILLLLTSCNTNGQPNQSAGNYKVNSNFEADIDIALTATEKPLQIFNGEKTGVYTYQAELIKGDPKPLKTIPGSYLGPVIRIKPGQKIRIRFENQLSRESIIH
ncbi:MAG TPA: multicopper oxidase domain-containing protein, partial [Bacteroidales bacterium]|nr:multicopper oxidase domain-containing protein [Bacteroidales bacterium]